MNQYNSRLATTQYANMTISQRLQASQSQAEQQKDKAIDGISEGSRLVGAEFLKNSLEGLGGRLSKVTGLKSVGQLGKNISDKGFAKGLAKTIADSKKEAVKMGTEFGKDKIDELTKKAKGFLNKATPEDSLLRKLVGGTTPEEILSGKTDLLSKLNLDDVKAQASAALDNVKGQVGSAVGDVKGQAAAALDNAKGQAATALDDAKGQAAGLQGQATNALNDAKVQSQEALGAAKSQVGSAVGDAKSQAAGLQGQATSALNDAKSQAAGLQGQAQAAVGDAKSQAAGLQGQATSALDDAKGQAASAVGDAKSQAAGLQGQATSALDDAKGQAAGLQGQAKNVLGSVEDEAGDALAKGQATLDRLQAGTGLPNLFGDAEKSSSGVFGKLKGLFSRAVNSDKLQQIKSDAQKALDIAGKQTAKEVNPFTGETIKSKLFSDPDAAPKFDLISDGKGGFLQEEGERIFDKRSGDLASDLSKGKKTLFDPFDFSSQSNKLDAMKKKALGQVEETKAQLAKQAENLKAQSGSAVEDLKATAGDLKSKAGSVAEDLKTKAEDLKTQAEDLSTDSGKNISQAFQEEAENKVRGVYDDVAASNEFGDEFGNLSLQTPKTLKVSGTAIPEPEPEAKAPEPEPSFQPSQDSGGPAPTTTAPEPTVQPKAAPPVSAPEQDSSLVSKATSDVEKDTSSLTKDIETGAEDVLNVGTDGIGGEVFEGLLGLGSIVLPSLLGGDTPTHSRPLTSGLSQTSTMGLGR